MERFERVPDTIPDAELYGPRYQPWLSRAWRSALREGDPRSLVTLDRKYVLRVLLEQSLLRGPGDVAECGVYKGGTAYLFAELLAGSGRTLHLFDTFGGMPPTDACKDIHVEGDFDDTSLARVKEYLGSFPWVRFHPGRIPATLDEVSDRTFAFVHVDLDIHDAILAASAFFYPRMAPNSIVVYDDYGFASCPGARAAVDAFYATVPEKPLVLSTGQCVVWKH